MGPLPVSNGTTTVSELNYPYNKGKGYQRIYNQDTDLIADFNYEVGMNVSDLTVLLINGVSILSHYKF